MNVDSLKMQLKTDIMHSFEFTIKKYFVCMYNNS